MIFFFSVGPVRHSALPEVAIAAVVIAVVLLGLKPVITTYCCGVSVKPPSSPGIWAFDWGNAVNSRC